LQALNVQDKELPLFRPCWYRQAEWFKSEEWLKDTLEKLPTWPNSRIDELLP